MKNIYLLLTIIGSILPWSFLGGFFLEEGLAMDLFLQSIFANIVTSAVAADLLISATVFLIFAFIELKRLGISSRWLFLYILPPLEWDYHVPYLYSFFFENRRSLRKLSLKLAIKDGNP